MFNIENIFGIPITTDFKVEIILNRLKKKELEETKTISFVNPHSYYMIEKDSNYREQIFKMDYLLCDGIGVARLARNKIRKNVSRLSFDDTSLAPTVFGYAAKKNLKIGIIGAKGNVYIDFSNKLKLIYLGLDITPISDGYQNFEEIENRLKNSNIDILIIGMGIPMQEKLASHLKSKLSRTMLIFTCGGYLDQKVKKNQYYPKIVDKLNIRFLYRLFKEPRRLWKRYLIEYNTFIFLYIKSKIS